jgi:3-hydroxyisobutyrate dehydrogenase-like beta-hydroxyacid dehydrogenase
MPADGSRSVGFIGLGAMGAAMAARLAEEGVAVTAWNRSPEPADQLRGRSGIEIADSPGALFERHAVVHSILAHDAAALTVISDELLAASPPGRVHVNHATLSPTAAAQLAERHARHGVGYVSAPVLGRSTVAATGALLVVASGEPAAIDRAMPTLEVLGQRVWNLGPDPRLAPVVKIAVNYSLISAIQSMAESLTLIEAAGIDPADFVEILTHTAFSGSAHRGYAPIIAERRYEPVGFAMELGLKDLGLAETAASDLGVELPVSPVLRELFTAALADERLRELDWAAVAEITRRRAR